MQSLTIAGFLDELEKISARKGTASWMQTRSGTRPIRVHNLVGRDSLHGLSSGVESREQSAQAPELERPDDPEPAEETKEAADLGEAKTKALEGFVAARPYVSSTVQAAVPAAVLGGILGGPRMAKTLGVIGGGAGVANEALKQWAEKNKRRKLSKKILADD